MMSRKAIVCTLALLMVLGALIVNLPATLADTEPNDDFATAEPLAPMTPVFGGVDVTDTDDYYETATTADDQTVSATVYVADTLTVNLYMYDAAQVEVYSNLSITGDLGVLYHTFATAQTVYIRIQHVSGTGAYELYHILLDDIIKPSITHTPVTTVKKGEEINITAEVTDNVGVREVRLNYTGVDGIVHNVTMTGYQDNYTYHIPAQAFGAHVHYFIWANDTSDPSLQNRTSNYTISVIDDMYPPMITHTAVTEATDGEAIKITATISDNVGVESATLYYRMTGETAFSSLTMVILDNVYIATIPATAVTTDGVEYYISATDGTHTSTFPAMNPTTSPQQIEVPKEEEEFPWIWIIIILVFVIVVIIIIAVLARRRTPATFEEEFEAP